MIFGLQMQWRWIVMGTFGSAQMKAYLNITYSSSNSQKHLLNRQMVCRPEKWLHFVLMRRRIYGWQPMAAASISSIHARLVLRFCWRAAINFRSQANRCTPFMKTTSQGNGSVHFVEA